MQNLTLGARLLPLCALSLSALATAQTAALERETYDPLLGGPLFVGGVEIPQQELQRYVIYGPGRAALEYRRLACLIADEVERQRAETEPARDPAALRVDPAELLWHYERKLEEFQLKYPSLDVDREMSRAYRAADWYRRELEQELLFDQVFLPDDFEEWPELSKELIRAGGDVMGEMLDDFAEVSRKRKDKYAADLAEWERKRAAGEDPGPEPHILPEDPFFRQLLRGAVRDSLYSFGETRTAFHGLPPELVLTYDLDADGEPELVLDTETLWREVRATTDVGEVADARACLAKLEATRQRLDREGYLLDDEEVVARIEGKFGVGLDQLFAKGAYGPVGLQRFPSIETYRNYLDLLVCYRASIASELERPGSGLLPPRLEEHYPRANGIMGIARCKPEVLWVGAFDEEAYQWREGGWLAARLRAEHHLRGVQENGAQWEAERERRLQVAAGEGPPPGLMSPDDFWFHMLDDNNEFWDPPAPTAPHGKAANVGRKNGGRWPLSTRYELQALMGESYYGHFLSGRSVTDTLFFDAPVGEVVGPFKGPKGYYLAKVLQRRPPQSPLNARDDRYLKYLVDDYVAHSFITYADRALGVGLHSNPHLLDR